MAIIMIGLGETRLGTIRRDKNGNEVKTPAQWTSDPKGGSVCVCLLNPETMEPEGDAEIYGDWDAAAYLKRVLELLKPTRRSNLPELKSMVRAANKDGCDICEYCYERGGCHCQDCIVQGWKEKVEDHDL